MTHNYLLGATSVGALFSKIKIIHYEYLSMSVLCLRINMFFRCLLSVEVNKKSIAKKKRIDSC